jgi:hypothetical protein
LRCPSLVLHGQLRLCSLDGFVTAVEMACSLMGTLAGLDGAILAHPLAQLHGAVGVRQEVHVFVQVFQIFLID